MNTVHWLGAGLSSAPGVRHLATRQSLILWNRTPGKAQSILGAHSAASVERFDFDALTSRVQPGDILVSMLPGDFHCRIAEIALARKAHFISSSYLSPEMVSFDAAAKEAGLSLVNEVGLDPGIDHLMAHALVDAYRNSGCEHPLNKLAFRSYCGGFPAQPNPFRYKFSWSPLGVLKALKTPARCLSGGDVTDIARPWLAVSNYRAPLTGGSESFEAYPNRDSLPFMRQYHFDPQWQVEEFVRGTLRLNGWTEAWAEIFTQIDTLQGDDTERNLRTLSDQLWKEHAYEDDEADRVVLCVELSAQRNAEAVWHQSYVIDAIGDDRGSAMARLVSYTVAIAVESVLQGELNSGVSTGATDPHLAQQWMRRLGDLGETISLNNH